MKKQNKIKYADLTKEEIYEMVKDIIKRYPITFKKLSND